MKNPNKDRGFKSRSAFVLILLISIFLASCTFLRLNVTCMETNRDPQSSTGITQTNNSTPTSDGTNRDDHRKLDENGSYTTKEDVALYIHLYGRLPNNFITKSEARTFGWTGGRLENYAPGKCIGGDTFYNREGLLPKKSGRTYTECDIDTLGAPSRGKKRIVFSNDGLVYYTDDHYESFTLLYGNP